MSYNFKQFDSDLKYLQFYVDEFSFRYSHRYEPSLACGASHPAPLHDQNAGVLAEHVGREIIQRWLKTIPPEVWSHQGCHHFWNILATHGSWQPVTGDPMNREWVPGKPAMEKA